MTKEQVKEIIKSTPSEVLADIVPQENELAKVDKEIDIYIAKRQAFIQKVNAICVEGKDYHVIQGKKSLAKGGAEKIASIFHWTAKFDKDTESLEMLGDIKGLVAFKCTLMNGQFVGEGRGAAMLSKNGNDPNKTLKMAQKSAFIDATLRASGLSDFFTQDLGPEDEGAGYNHLAKQPFNKNDWQNKNRAGFKQEYGYSQATHYRFDGVRDEVLKRDSYSCVWCGMTNEEHQAKWQKPITVDHMDKNENNNSLENLQTLCLSCHGKKDISPDLIEPKAPQDKEIILKLRKEGKTYQAIADELGYSIRTIWKWVQRWTQPQNQHVATGKQPSEKQKMFIKKLCTEKGITQPQLKELAVTYKGNPSGLIDYLLNHKKEIVEKDLPVIQQQEEMSEEDAKLVDSIPF